MSKQKDLNTLNEKFQDLFPTLRKKLEDAGATDAQIQKVYDIRKEKANDIIKGNKGDALDILNSGGSIPIKGGTTLGEISQKGSPDMSTKVGLGKENMWKKSLGKAGSKLPALGAVLGGYSALNGGDAMAAGLSTAAAYDPTGVSDLASDVYNRSKMSPEEREEMKKQDINEHVYTRGIGDDQMQQLEDTYGTDKDIENQQRAAKLQALKSLPQQEYVSQRQSQPLQLPPQEYVTQRQAPNMVGQLPERDIDELNPLQSQGDIGRFSRTFKDKGTYRE